MVRVIYHIWEICQMHGCCQWPNGKYGYITRNRNHFTVRDFRVSGKYAAYNIYQIKSIKVYFQDIKINKYKNIK